MDSIRVWVACYWGMMSFCFLLNKLAAVGVYLGGVEWNAPVCNLPSSLVHIIPTGLQINIGRSLIYTLNKLVTSLLQEMRNCIYIFFFKLLRDTIIIPLLATHFHLNMLHMLQILSYLLDMYLVCCTQKLNLN